MYALLCRCSFLAPSRAHAAGAATLAALLAMTAPSVSAESLQPGLWRVTSSPTINGAAGAPQVKMRCVTPEEASDIDRMFSPQVQTQNECERTEHEVSGTRLKWRLKCTGQPNMDVAGTFAFDTPQHYSAVVTSEVSIAGQSMKSHVAIEGERTGDCP